MEYKSFIVESPLITKGPKNFTTHVHKVDFLNKLLEENKELNIITITKIHDGSTENGISAIFLVVLGR